MVLRLLSIVAAAAVVLGALAVAVGALVWRGRTKALRAGLEAARLPPAGARHDARELEGLPAPVQRFFRTALRHGQPMVAAADLEHSGLFNASTGAERWRPFTSTQRVVTRPPGFDWDGRIAMAPGLTVRVHDAYVAGEGVLHASLLGLITVADERGRGELARGELMRYLAEAAWYPTALLPSQGVRWEAAGEHAAWATLTDGGVSARLRFHFGPDGLIDTVWAEARGRSVDGAIVPTPWQGRFWNPESRGGMQVPLDGEVGWVLPAGVQPYWRGRVTAIRHTFAK